MRSEQQLDVVQVRPGIVLVVVFGLMIIVGLIFFNLSSTMHKMHVKDPKENKLSVQNFASDMDTTWYRTETKHKVTTFEKDIPKVDKKSAILATEPQVPLSPVMQRESTSQNEKDLLEAMKAPITSNQLTDQQAQYQKTQNDNEVNQSSINSQTSVRNDQNMQMEKSSFLAEQHQQEDEYLHSMLKDPLSPYEIQEGTIIPGTLISGINSDLPGQITAQVSANVYDSISGKYLLIPQGAKIEGVYDSNIAYGQERVLVVWKRIIYPNGQSLNLEGMQGVDMSGYAGFQDQVNNHYTKLLGSVVLMSALASGAQLSQPPQSENPFASPTIGQTLAQSLGTNIANVGTAVISKTLSIQPQIEIRQAYQFNIIVKKDIIFMKPYDVQI